MVDYRELLHRDRDESIKQHTEGHMAGVWTALPCLITKFDPVAITVEAQPTIQGVVTVKDTPPKYFNLPKLVDVPVLFQRGGGYTFTFPIVVGDECLVIFASREIDGWWQSGQISPPSDLRMHDLSDGFALVGPFSQKTKITNVSTTTAQMRSDDGTLLVELDKVNGFVNIDAPTQVNINAPRVVMSGVLFIENQQAVANALTIIQAGAIVGASDMVTSKGISSEHHEHTGAGGTGISGPPVNS